MSEIVETPISRIEVGEHAQRLEAKDIEIDELAASIRRIGVLVPLILAKKGDSLQLVSGHRRLLAAARVGLSTVPCIVADSTKAQPSEITFAENFFRKDLSSIELAAALKDCIKQDRMSVTELAASFHKSENWVRSMIDICDWPPDVTEAIHYEKLSLSAGHNLALVTDGNYRSFLVRNAVEQGATARTTASWLQAWRVNQPQEEAITQEPGPPGAIRPPAVPQAPCLCCGNVFGVDEMSHVPLCLSCLQTIRQAGMSAG